MRYLFQKVFWQATLFVTVSAWLMPSLLFAASVLYSVARDDAELRIINQATGATESSLSMTLAGETITGATGLALNPLTNELFGLLKLSGSAGRELVIIDLITGVTTSVGNTGEGFAGIAFDASGTLFGVTGDGGSTAETLFTLSLTDASSTFFQSLGNGDDGESIAFNPDAGLMYHGSGRISKIFETVNLTTHGVTNVSLTGAGLFDEFLALTYAGSNSFFLSGNNLDGRLFQITTDGVVTLFGDMDHVSKGLVLLSTVTSIPEPATIFLFGSGILGLIGYARRRQRILHIW